MWTYPVWPSFEVVQVLLPAGPGAQTIPHSRSYTFAEGCSHLFRFFHCVSSVSIALNTVVGLCFGSVTGEPAPGEGICPQGP